MLPASTPPSRSRPAPRIFPSRSSRRNSAHGPTLRNLKTGASASVNALWPRGPIMFRGTWFSGWIRTPKLSQRVCPGTQQARRFRPSLESLEDRLAPAATPAHLYVLDASLADAMGGPALVADGGSIAAGRYAF